MKLKKAKKKQQTSRKKPIKKQFLQFSTIFLRKPGKIHEKTLSLEYIVNNVRWLELPAQVFFLVFEKSSAKSDC